MRLLLALALAVLLAGCGGPAPTSPDAACTGSGCEAPDAASRSDGALPSAPDAALLDASVGADGSQATDGAFIIGGDGGGATGDGGAVEPAGAIADYLACSADYECPVGYGDCIKTIPLNRKDAAGRNSLTVLELAPGAAKPGICTLVCTSSSATCDGLSIKDNSGQPVPYQCQLVAAGAPFYPSPRPAFPFDAQLSAADLAAGDTFGALCRPPFGLSNAVGDAFCQRCTQASECSDRQLCFDFTGWDLGTSQAAGSCLGPCGGQSPCPFGFECQDLVSQRADGPFDHGSFCVPWLRTCGACSDPDGDGRGLGRCGPGDAVTAVDCDERDPSAYYDPADPEHAFPGACGVQDLNCNGLSDDLEEIGPALYPQQHCTACFDACSGAVPNGTAVCTLKATDASPRCTAQCDDPTAWADCDGELANGCEQAITDPARIWYPDADGDGFGGEPGLFACTPDAIPAGYTQVGGDCDDTRGSVRPGGVEVCNGVDDDCDGATDEDPLTEGAACHTGLPGVCEPGARHCVNGTIECLPITPPSEEACDGLDNDCDGITDELPGTEVKCQIPGKFGPCAEGVTACVVGTTDTYCKQTVFPKADLPDPLGEDLNCDGVDGDASQALFVRPATGNPANDGSASAPLDSLDTAISRLPASGKKYIYLTASGSYQRSAAIVLGNGQGIFGGFDEAFSRAVGTSTVHRLGSGTSDHLVAIDGNDLVDPTYLMNLSVEMDRPSAPALHAVGLRCKHCPGLRLTNMTIAASQGADGAAGSNGASYNLGAVCPTQPLGGIAGFGSICNPTAGGKGWDAGVSGGPTGWRMGGAGGAAGTASSLAGKPGSVGTSCSTLLAGGAGGKKGTSVDATAELRWVRGALAGPGKGDCNGSGGGGGGGSYSCSLPGFPGSGGGAGGCGGGQGGAGAPGGTSIGMLVWNSTGMVLDTVTVRGGGGGRGGQGGSGGFAGGGGTPTAPSAGGGAGGIGGNGAGGSGGGGGAGGSSFAIVRDSGTTFTATKLTESEGSAGGGGGAGGGNAGGTTAGVAAGGNGGNGALGDNGDAQQDLIL
ncbi:MAG TPA: putative metal-binding motif-containing protein [Myxococcales bacterium]|jgi:hypothetical protein